MKEYMSQYSDYAKAAFFYSLLSLVGSLFSIINIIPLMITYQLLEEAKRRNLNPHAEKIINNLLQASLLLTLCITIFYLSIHL